MISTMFAANPWATVALVAAFMLGVAAITWAIARGDK